MDKESFVMPWAIFPSRLKTSTNNKTQQDKHKHIEQQQHQINKLAHKYGERTNIYMM